MYDIPLDTFRSNQRSSVIEPPDLYDVKKSSIKYNGFEYQLIPVEIEKEAELGLVVGQVDGEPMVFIDEILPNGMIDMHGTLKEGDYLVQAGVYSLIGIDVTVALVLIERAYDEGRKSLSFVAARQLKPDRPKPVIQVPVNQNNVVNGQSEQTTNDNKTDKQEEKVE